jgi:hypothetical protein
MRCGVWAAIVAAGCGRFAFDPRALGDGSVGDGAGDGSGDGAGDAAELVCLGSYDVCDGFEGSTIDPLWMPDPMITIDTTRAHSGASSAHVHTPAFGVGMDSYTLLAEEMTLMTASTLWIRSWLWLSALPAGANGLELVAAQTPGAGGDYLFVFSDQTHVYSQYAGLNDVSPVTVPTGVWFCAVFKIVRATTPTGSLEASGDVPLLVLPNAATDGVPPLQYITIGLGFAGTNVVVPQPALDLWIDDVIIDDAPVTCQQ